MQSTRGKLKEPKMQHLDDDITIINSRSAGMGDWAAAAAIDAKLRNKAAVEKYPEFFLNEDHVARVKEVRQILVNFFEKGTIYENKRENGGKPFTVVKITKHRFPAVSLAEKKRRYRDPLAALGVEIKFAQGTNSYLYYIK